MSWLAKLAPSSSVWAHRLALAALVVLAGVVASVTLPRLGLIPADLEERFAKAELNLIFSAYAALLAVVVAWRAGSRREGRHMSLLLGYVAACMALSVVPSGHSELWRRLTFSAFWMGAIVEGFKFWTSFPVAVTAEAVDSLLERAPGRGFLAMADRVTARVTGALVGTTWAKVVFTVLALGFAYQLVGPGSHRYNILSDFVRPTASPRAVEILLAVSGGLVIITLVGVAWTGFRLADREQRKRVLWIVLSQLTVAGFTVASLMLPLLDLMTGSEVVGFLRGVLAVVYHPAVWFVDLSGFAVAIFYSGAFDLRPIISKTTVYGALFLTLTLLFATVEQLAQSVLTNRLGIPDGFGAWLGAGTIAVAMGPIRERLERFIRGLGQALEKELEQP